MKRLALLGAGGHGKVAAEAAEAAGWGLIEFFDDRWQRVETAGRWPIVGSSADLERRCREYDGVLISIGDCRTRWDRQSALRRAGASVTTVVHPFSWVSPSAKLGPGSLVIAGAVINAGAVIGDAAIVNSGATVDHDCVLGEAVHVAPGAHLLGNVTVGARTWVGAGAVVKQGTTVGAGVMIGAGAVVISDMADGGLVIGNPARSKQLQTRTLAC